MSLRTGFNSRPFAVVGLLLAAVPSTVLRAEWNIGSGQLSAEATASTYYMSNAEARRGGASSLLATFAPSFDFERRGSLIETHALAGVEFEHPLSGPGVDREIKRASLAFAAAKGSNPRFAPSLRTQYTESYTNDFNVNARVFTRQTTTAVGADAAFSPDLTGAFTSTYETSRTAGYPGRHSFENRGRIDSALGGRRTVFTELTHRTIASDGPAAAALDQRSLNTVVGFSQSFWTATRASVGLGYLERRRSAAETRQPAGGSGVNVMAAIEGPFLPPARFPKLTSRLRISYGQLDNPGLQDNGGKQLTGDLALGWAARAGTRLGLSASRTRDLTVTDLTMENTTTRLLVDQELGRRTVLTVAAGYEWRTVRGLVRYSRGAVASFAAVRKLGSRDRWEGRFAYDYRDLTSSEQIANFAQHTGRLATTYRF